MNTLITPDNLNLFNDLMHKNLNIVKMDLNGIVTYANDNFCNTTGFMRKELIGEPHFFIQDEKIF